MSLIAERVGFPNSAYFSRVYKQATSQSPAQFRSQTKVTVPMPQGVFA
jgi:AraC-like DNA-binding protein